MATILQHTVDTVGVHTPLLKWEVVKKRKQDESCQKLIFVYCEIATYKLFYSVEWLIPALEALCGPLLFKMDVIKTISGEKKKSLQLYFIWG